MGTTSASWQAASWLRFAGRVVSLLELVQRDGKNAKTLTCRVIDGVGNRRRYADEADLPQPFGSDGVEGEVRFVDMASWVFPSRTVQIAATMLG